MKLWHSVGARSLRPLWAFKELGMVPASAGGAAPPEQRYDLVTMPFPPRLHHKPFLGVNPLGTIPFMTHGDVEITESCAAAVYAAEVVGGPTTPLTVRASEGDYAAYLNWIFHADATLTFPQTLVLRYVASSTARDCLSTARATLGTGTSSRTRTCKRRRSTTKSGITPDSAS